MSDIHEQLKEAAAVQINDWVMIRGLKMPLDLPALRAELERLREENGKYFDDFKIMNARIVELDAEIAAWKKRFDPDGVCGFDGTSIVMSG